MATLNEKNTGNNPVAGADGHILEAQPNHDLGAEYHDCSTQGKRGVFRFGVTVLILTTLLAFVIAGMVGIFQIKKDVDHYLDSTHTPLAVIGARSIDTGIHVMTSPSDDCVSISGYATLPNSTSTTTLTVNGSIIRSTTGTITATQTLGTVTVGTSTLGNSITTTETALPVQATCGRPASGPTTITIFISSVPTGVSSMPAPVDTSAVSPVQVTVLTTTSTTTTTLTTTSSSSTGVASGSLVIPYFSANSTYLMPTAPSASHFPLSSTSAVAGVTGVLPSTSVTSDGGRSDKHGHKSNGVSGGRCVVMTVAMVAATILFIL